MWRSGRQRVGGEVRGASERVSAVDGRMNSQQQQHKVRLRGLRLMRPSLRRAPARPRPPPRPLPHEGPTRVEGWGMGDKPRRRNAFVGAGHASPVPQGARSVACFSDLEREASRGLRGFPFPVARVHAPGDSHLRSPTCDHPPGQPRPSAIPHRRRARAPSAMPMASAAPAPSRMGAAWKMGGGTETVPRSSAMAGART
jgi:hypothetical protein